jgi:hypothetical protein
VQPATGGSPALAACLAANGAMYCLKVLSLCSTGRKTQMFGGMRLIFYPWRACSDGAERVGLLYTTMQAARLLTWNTLLSGLERVLSSLSHCTGNMAPGVKAQRLQHGTAGLGRTRKHLLASQAHVCLPHHTFGAPCAELRAPPAHLPEERCTQRAAVYLAVVHCAVHHLIPARFTGRRGT